MALSKINLQSSEAIASLNEERPLLSRRAHPVRLPDIQRSFLSGDPPEIYPKGHKLRISAVYEKNPLRPLGEPDFLCFQNTMDQQTFRCAKTAFLKI